VGGAATLEIPYIPGMTTRIPLPTDRCDQVEVIGADEVASLLGVDRKTVYAAARHGEIPHRRIGRRLLFERGSIVEWLRQGRVVPNNGDNK
jgi:excisionase family DNA binding protein